MFRFGPAKILHFDAGIYCAGEGAVETELSSLWVDGREFAARATLHITTSVEALAAVRDPYAETRIALRGTARLCIVSDDGAFRFDGEAASEQAGFMVLRANELAELELRHAMRLTGGGSMNARLVHGSFFGQILGFDPAGYPEFELVYEQDVAAVG